MNKPSLSTTYAHTTPLNFRAFILPSAILDIRSSPDPKYGGFLSKKVFTDFDRLRAQATLWKRLGRPGLTNNIWRTPGPNEPDTKLSDFNFNNPAFLD